MNKTIAAAAVSASLAVGGLAGAALGAPTFAGAAGYASTAVTTASDGAGWVQDALAGLVGDGTITQEQADAVETALQEARPERRGHHLHHIGRGVVADALGISEDELHTALRDGQTIADVAEAQGVEVQAVIDAVLTDLEERLGERVADGDLTQERLDEILAEAAERLPDVIEGEAPAFGGGHRRGGR